MKIIKKIFFPFLPDTFKLQKHWWHRLIKVITAIFVSIIYVIIVFNFLSFPYYDIASYFKAPSHVYQITDLSNNTYYIGSEDLGRVAKDKYPQFFKEMNFNQAADKTINGYSYSIPVGTTISASEFERLYPGKTFDYIGAKNSGLSNQQIEQSIFLHTDKHFDLTSAIKSGLSPQQINDSINKFILDNQSKELSSSEAESIVTTAINSSFAYKNGARPSSKSEVVSILISNASFMLIVLLIFIPSLIYRTFLYIFLNNSWKK